MGRTFLLSLWVLVPGSGCGSGQVAAPTYQPAEVARQAMAQYDSNQDGQLQAKELERCPALKKSLAHMDKNGDGGLDEGEIEKRLLSYRESQVHFMSVLGRVHKDGQPVKGALVTLMPEKFHGSALQPARGTSGADGQVVWKMEGENIPGMVACGFYRIEVSLKDSSGRETLPSRFNTETTLGREVGPAVRGPVDINLGQP